MTQPDGERTLRLCDVCGQLDTDPRHVMSVDPDHPNATPTQDYLAGLPDGVPALALAEVLDPTTVIHHHDCGADNGCGTCASVLEATGRLTGDKLLKALTDDKARSVTSAPQEG